jgi:hypothetical protein
VRATRIETSVALYVFAAAYRRRSCPAALRRAERAGIVRRMSCRIALAGCLLVISASVGVAQDLISPDRPGIADGSTVVGAGRFQIETALQHESRGEIHTIFLPTLFRAGAGDRFEIRVEGNTFTHEAGASGFAPTSIGAKYTVIDSTDGPTLGIIGRGFPASGSGGFKTRHFTGDVRLAADIPLGPTFSLNPNAGVARYEDDGETFAAGLFACTLNYEATETVNPFVDIGYQSSTGRATGASVTLDAGIAIIIGRNIQLDASAGQGVSGDAPRPFVAVGVSLRFGAGSLRPHF